MYACLLHLFRIRVHVFACVFPNVPCAYVLYLYLRSEVGYIMMHVVCIYMKWRGLPLPSLEQAKVAQELFNFCSLLPVPAFLRDFDFKGAVIILINK